MRGQASGASNPRIAVRGLRSVRSCSSCQANTRERIGQRRAPAGRLPRRFLWHGSRRRLAKGWYQIGTMWRRFGGTCRAGRFATRSDANGGTSNRDWTNPASAGPSRCMYSSRHDAGQQLLVEKAPGPEATEPANRAERNPGRNPCGSATAGERSVSGARLPPRYPGCAGNRARGPASRLQGGGGDRGFLTCIRPGGAALERSPIVAIALRRAMRQRPASGWKASGSSIGVRLGVGSRYPALGGWHRGRFQRNPPSWLEAIVLAEVLDDPGLATDIIESDRMIHATDGRHFASSAPGRRPVEHASKRVRLDESQQQGVDAADNGHLYCGTSSRVRVISER